MPRLPLLLCASCILWSCASPEPGREATYRGANGGIDKSPAQAQAKASPMREEDFWFYIEGAKKAAGANVEARTKWLTQELAELSFDSIEAFQRRYDELIKRSYRWDLWGAAYLMNGGCSDDCFRYFRDWLISEGRDTFESALANPDSLSQFAPREYFELESFAYVARKVYRSKSGGQEPAIDYSGELGRPAGTEWSEAELPRMFPKLAAKYLRHSTSEDRFVASEPPITPAQWQRLLDEVKSTPGARVQQQGPMLIMIVIDSQAEPVAYLFTQPAHPAHPAYLKAFPASPRGQPTKVVGNYAGSKIEFEEWARSLMAFLTHK